MNKNNGFLSKLGFYIPALFLVLILLCFPLALINSFFPFLEKLPGGKVIGTVVGITGLLVYWVGLYLNAREKNKSAK